MLQKNRTELRSLNVELPVLYAEELEQRLETDPLTVGGLAGHIAEFDNDAYSCDVHCGDKCDNFCSSFCGEHCESYCATKR